jgi:hypothetical protein
MADWFTSHDPRTSRYRYCLRGDSLGLESPGHHIYASYLCLWRSQTQNRRLGQPWQPALHKALEQLDKEAAEDVVLAAPEIEKLFPNDPGKAKRVIDQMMTSTDSCPASINGAIG